ncbi:T9SS type A sorting domain-containing protein [Rurimicrobium arvi]|uniref:Secretion system C-terminal sorting domain-containing protein n=1 Tax=Rurimicrobium arvi TaxID=2049916 RepID=A0ABP8MDU8_9BACT
MNNILFLFALLIAASSASGANLTATVSPAGAGKKNGKIILLVTGGNAPYTFSWTGPAGYSAGWQNPDSLGAGTYCVMVTDRFCGSAELCVTVDERPNSIRETAAPVAVTVYPNPFSDRIHIRLAGTPSGSVQLLLMDAAGRAIAKEQFSGANEFDWTMRGNLPAGMYFLVVQQADGHKMHVPLMRSGE